MILKNQLSTRDAEILRRVAYGESPARVAQAYNLTPAHVRVVVKRTLIRLAICDISLAGVVFARQHRRRICATLTKRFVCELRVVGDEAEYRSADGVLDLTDWWKSELTNRRAKPC